MRAVVCAALIALGVAGAGLFPAQPVAGQETEPVALHGAAALDQLKQTGQYESLQAAMNQARFNVSRVGNTPLGRAAWHAPNPAAGYDAYVTEAGVSIAVNDETYVSLSLHSLGYGAALRAIGPGEVSGDKQTINLTREGGVREWYVNGADGLEHGFTLSEPPPGARQKGLPLRLALQVSAGWRAVASEDGKRVILRGAGDEAVEYGKLVVRDHLGRNIPARLTVAGEQVVIEVEDHDAEYPLTIDPLFTLQQRLLAADGAAFEYFGHAVALSGNTALVGAPYDENSRGSAYVFVRNGATWTQQARLLGQDGALQDYFGWSVALNGDTALVGTLYGPGSVNSDQGAAYVFVRTGTTQPVWTQQKKLTANDGHAFALFGTAVALDGDTALVGAPDHQIIPGFVNTGAAFVFVRNGTAWTQQVRLEANDAGGGDRFGEAVALDGDTALVGAPKDDVGTKTDQGSAYLFTRNSTSWMQQPRLTTTDSAAGDQFGNAVALSGEKALIGAYLYGSDDRGAMFTFRRGATGWAETDTTIAPNPTAGAHFGVSLALSGDTAVVGASLGLFTQGVDQRSAYVFVFGGEWFPVRQLGPELGTANDGFGYAVALDGDTVLVGAYRGDAAATDQGAAYAFVLHDSRHVEQQKLFANDGAANDYFGNAVALDGNTVAVGAYTDSIGTNIEQGSVYVFTRSGTGWAFQQKLTANDGAAGDFFGTAVALSGDTLAVGAAFDDSGPIQDQGAAYIFTRNGAMWTQQPKIIANGGASQDYFGGAVALSGDTLAVGAVGANTDQGAVYVFTRTIGGWAPQPKLTANDSAPGDDFGNAVALSGDTLAVGAQRDAIGTNNAQGSVYVFTRSGTGWAFQQKLTASDGALGDFFGAAVALHGDTLAAGAPSDTIGANTGQGSAYVFARTGTAWAFRQKLFAADGEARDNFGGAVALSGDLLVAGALFNKVGTSTQQGSAYVYTRIGNWQQQQKLTASDGASGDLFGGAVAISGDTVVVGADGDNIGTNNNQGSVYAFVSPACPTLTLNPASLPNGAVGAAYDQTITLNGTTVPSENAVTVSAGALPPGLRLDSNDHDGLLRGTPTAPGTYRFTITITHYLSGCPASRSYTLTITPPCSTITVNPATLPNGTQGTAYSQTITATGGAAPYSYSVTAGALPAGLSLSNAGALTGTPTAIGAFNFTVRATGANGCQGTRAYTLTIGSSACNFSVAPANHAFPFEGGSGVVSVNAGDGCAWTAVSHDPWLTITSGANGSGNGTVRFAVAKNPNAAARRGALSIAGRRVTVVQAPSIACVSAASFAPGALATESIVAAFGSGLAKSTEAATSQPLPTALAGTRVSVLDSLGVERFAPLFFVSPTQINFQVPPGTAAGKALVTILRDGETVAAGSPRIEMVAPGLFSANASGQGMMIGVALRVKAEGSQSYEPVVRYDEEQKRFVAAPIDLGAATDRVFLVLFATGARHRGSLGAVSVKIGGENADALYAGPQGSFAGLDQLNVLLPRSLAGRGEMDVSVLVEGQEANKLRVAVK